MPGGKNPRYDPYNWRNNPSKAQMSANASQRGGDPNVEGTAVNTTVTDISRIKWPGALEMSKLLQTDVGGVPVGYSTLCDNAKKAYSLCRTWILSYGSAYGKIGDVDFQMFRADWRTFRHTIPLQTRLIVEQALFDLGKPWRSLCSGFSPLRE